MPENRLDKTDDRLADLFDADWDNGLRGKAVYDHSHRRWHVWDGIRWAKDRTAQVPELIRTLANEWITGKDANGAKVRIVSYLFDMAKKESVLKSLAGRPGFALTGSEWDQNPRLLACKNGVIDLETGEFNPNPDPADFISLSSPVEWDPEAQCPQFINFLTQITGGNDELREYLLRVLGYAMFGWQREQKFWLWVGTGNNGKGTLAKIITSVLGEYADSPSSELYMRTKFGATKSDSARADLVRLQGLRFTWMSEPQGGHFNDELIKAHTGDDPILARALYSNDYVTFRPTHTLVFLTNNEPKVDDVGPSMRRRVRVIKFEQDFSAAPDFELEDRLVKEESAGILRLLVAAAVTWAQNGLAEPKIVTDWSQAYIESNDVVAQFILEACVIEEDAKVSAKVIFAEYLDWVRDRGETAMSATGFGILLAKRFAKTRSASGVAYAGVRPRSAADV